MATFYERIRNVFTNELDQVSQPSEISGTEQVAETNYLFQEYERGKLEGLTEGQQQGRDELASAIKNRMQGAAEEIGDYWIGELLQNGIDEGDVQQYFRGQIDAHNTQVGHLEELKSHGRITIDPPTREDFAKYREQVTNYAESQREEEYGFDSSEDGEDESVSRLLPVTPEMTALADRIQSHIQELSLQLQGIDEDSYDTRTTIRREMGYLGTTAHSLGAGRQDIDLTIDIDTEQDEYGIREEEDSYTAIISRISPLLQEARALGFNTDVSLYEGEPEHEKFDISSQETPTTPENNYGYLDAQIQQVVAASRASRAIELTQAVAISPSQPTTFVSPTRAQQFARETPRVEQDFGISL